MIVQKQPPKIYPNYLTHIPQRCSLIRLRFRLKFTAPRPAPLSVQVFQRRIAYTLGTVSRNFRTFPTPGLFRREVHRGRGCSQRSTRKRLRARSVLSLAPSQSRGIVRPLLLPLPPREIFPRTCRGSLVRGPVNNYQMKIPPPRVG